MPKIRDLAINAIPAEADLDTRRFWMNNGWVAEPPKPKPPGCKPSPDPRPPRPSVGVPADEIIRMKQQLQQRINTRIHM